MAEKHLVEEVIEDVVIPGLRMGSICVGFLLLVNFFIKLCGGDGFEFSPLSGYLGMFLFHYFLFLWKKGAFRK